MSLTIAQLNTLSYLNRSLERDAQSINTLFGTISGIPTPDGRLLLTDAQRNDVLSIIRAQNGDPTSINALFALSDSIGKTLSPNQRASMKTLLLALSGDPAALDVLGGIRIRQIGQRSAPLTALTDSQNYMCRIFETATQDIDSIGVDFANWYVNANVETAIAGTLTITGASVEFPAGTFTVLTFNGGSTSATIPSGGNAIGDIVSCQHIPAGSKYFIRWLWQGTANAPYCPQFGGNGLFTGGGDAIERNSANKVTSGTVTDTGLGVSMWPSVIKSRTSKRIPALIGDSREAGSGVVQDATGIVGSVAQAISSYTAFLKIAVAGDSARDFLASHAQRLALILAYTDFTISAFGINDIYSDAESPATLVSNQNAIAALVPGKSFYVTTLAPSTTSTDSWATLVNQTIGAQNTNTEAYNALVIAGLGGAITGGLDIRAAFEDSLTSGKWKVNGGAFAYTSDGLHPQRLANSGVVIAAAQIGL